MDGVGNIAVADTIKPVQKCFFRFQFHGANVLLVINRLFYNFARILCRLYFTIFHRVTCTGVEKLPLSGPLIIASNHESYLDPPLMSAALHQRDINFMAKKELFENFFMRILITNLAAFPVDRGSKGDKKAYVETLRILRENKAILIFPEGTRTKDGELGEFMGGVGRMMLSVPDCRILPVRIRGSFESFSGKRPIPKFCKISVSIGDSLDSSDYEGISDKKEKAELITQELRRRIEAL